MRYPHIVANSDAAAVVEIAAKINHRVFSNRQFSNMKEFASSVDGCPPL